jgi:hypothetical protein
MDFDHFETIPKIFAKYCTVIDAAKTSISECDKYFGWRVENGLLDSVFLFLNMRDRELE